MPRLRLTVFAFVLLCVCACAANASTAWPGYIHSLKPGVSYSPVTATLPPDVSITPPSPEVPTTIARWSGLWQGWACAGAVCDVKIAIERVSRTGATVVYAGASSANAVVHRGEAEFANDELHLRVPTGATVVMRLRADGDMELSVWRPQAQLLSAGVLTQRSLSEQARRTLERLATPWMHEGQPVTLVMATYRPAAGAGPWPTLVVNHGSTGEGNRPERFGTTFTDSSLVEHFTQQGWQVVFPQRRGRGGSGGLYDEGFRPDRSRYACEPEHSLPGFERAMEDLHLVMQQLAARPDVDARRIVMSGVSRGGILATAYAGAHPQQLAGVINFVGGWIGDRCPHVAQINPVLFQRGAAFARPTLWLYGSNDPFYSLRHSESNFNAFRTAGGQGRFVAYELPASHNGHYIAGRPDLWRADVQEYLRSVVLR